MFVDRAAMPGATTPLAMAGSARRPAANDDPATPATPPGSAVASAAEAAAIAAIRKLVDAAAARLARLERDGADEGTLQGARLELTTASSALADALAAQARRASEAAAAAAQDGLDTYA